MPTRDNQRAELTRRTFMAGAAATAAAVTIVTAEPVYAEDARPKDEKGAAVMKIGFHTDAFNTSYSSFEACLKWAQKNNVRCIECGLIDGVSWIHGLGYQPHVAMYEDPVLLRKKMDGYGVRFSQVDAAYPLSNKDGPMRGVPYVLNAIRWAKLTGCPCVDTTDGLHKPEGLDDPDAMDMMKREYQQIIEVAEAYEITINIEPHGYFTTKPEMMEKMLGFCDSKWLRMNMDTGKTFIAGQDPVAFLKKFLKKVSHVHVKDVSESLAAATRGKQTGIAVSQCAIGEGANADNIRKCLEVLRDNGYAGTLSMECEGQGGPMIEKSLAWMRKTLKELDITAE
ncbi:MAG: sugar phosphate isomerase/epimerase [Planctomycetota bacterium]|nr:sugar phosphate isomerase/epimerase [Planctomycetota bacterium]